VSRDRFAITPDGESGLHYLCAGYQAFFRHIDPAMTAMADLLRQRLPAADVMTVVQRDDPQRPRNSPCPCGGRRK